MKIVIGLGLIATLCSGCIIVPRHHHGYHPAAVVVRPECPPGHHWDGNSCRHNGNRHRR